MNHCESTLMQQLRDRTRPQHEALHEVVDMDWMTASPANYARSLTAYLVAVSMTESLSIVRQLDVDLDAASTAEPIDWSTRLVKTEWLRSDLDTLCDAGVIDASSRAGTGERWRDLRSPPAIEDLSSWIGVNYVTEGMTLGGRGIAPIIDERLGDGFGSERPIGTSFFASYGDQTGRMWNQFKTWADHCEVDPAAACHSAADTFDWFRECLARK